MMGSVAGTEEEEEARLTGPPHYHPLNYLEFLVALVPQVLNTQLQKVLQFVIIANGSSKLRDNMPLSSTY